MSKQKLTIAQRTATQTMGDRLGDPIYWGDAEVRYRVDDNQCIQFVHFACMGKDRCAEIHALGRTKEFDGPHYMTAETLDQYLKTRGL